MTICRAVISLRVSVPVLSVQMTEVAPSVSTAGSLRITALRPAMRRTPIASVMVITAGRPSGIAPTASATTAISASSQANERASTAKANNSTEKTKTVAVKRWAKLSIWRSSGVVMASTDSSSALILPISVRRPVATTIPVAWPAAISVPENAMLLLSPSAASAATSPSAFSAATDSPVSGASSTSTPRARTSRTSAGRRSPASSSTTSPSTSSRTGSCRRSPARRTTACGAIMPAIAASACSALPSCTKPTVALAMTTTRMTAASIVCPSNTAASAPPRRK